MATHTSSKLRKLGRYEATILRAETLPNGGEVPTKSYEQMMQEAQATSAALQTMGQGYGSSSYDAAYQNLLNAGGMRQAQTVARYSQTQGQYQGGYYQGGYSAGYQDQTNSAYHGQWQGRR